MTKRTKFIVTGGDHVARFSSYEDAIWFAREASKLDSPSPSRGFTIEVRAADGIIAQFRDGGATPEFAHIAA